jgi:RHS repeat-associated protein
VRQKFTGQQRDVETGLDYFESRYYSSAMGKFSSPDAMSGAVSNPQSLNLYTYVLNSPLVIIDPSGHQPQWLDYYDDIASERWNRGSYRMEAEDNIEKLQKWGDAKYDEYNAWLGQLESEEEQFQSDIKQEEQQIDNLQLGQQLVIDFGGILNDTLAQMDGLLTTAARMENVGRSQVVGIPNRNGEIAGLFGLTSDRSVRGAVELIKYALSRNIDPLQIKIIAFSNGNPNLASALSKLAPDLQFGAIILMAPNTRSIGTVRSITGHSSHVTLATSDRDIALIPGASRSARTWANNTGSNVTVLKTSNIWHSSKTYMNAMMNGKYKVLK